MDAHDGTIELQHFDGTIEAVEPESWISMRAEKTAPPEDWSGSVDINQEDFLRNRVTVHLDWQCELDSLEDDDELAGNDLTDFEDLH